VRTPVVVFSLFALAVVAALAVAGLPDRGSPSALAVGVSSFASGGKHNCAIIAGGVQCWGRHDEGQLGDGTQERRTAPVSVCQNYDDDADVCIQTFSGATQVALGGRHSCAIMSNGGMKCWGSNFHGRLGDDGECSPNCKTPTDVCADALCATLLSGVQAIGAGRDHTCAVMNDGGVKCWGDNGSGQLGDNTNNTRSTPVDVQALSGDAESVVGGESHTCALMEDGGVQCWGDNGSGQLGDNGECGTTCPIPVDVCADEACDDPLSDAVAIAAAADHTCAIVTGGRITCWGDNGDTQLVPFALCGPSCDAPEEVCNVYNQPATECAQVVTGATALVAGTSHHCFRTGAGGVRCWGLNHEGQLGDNTACAQTCTTPVTVCGDPTCAVPLSGATAIAAGEDHTCALVGPIKCWGLDDSHQLGDGTKGAVVCACRTAPVEAQIKVSPQPTPPIAATRTPTRTPPPGPGCLLIGDANGDGNVNAIDASLILQRGAGLVGGLTCNAQADVNGDGSVNAIDASLVLQYAAGLLDQLPP
jgi:alpha-tubulin suppressor-like RCC1 family protein